MWQQNYEPVGGSLGLSALVAAIPIARALLHAGRAAQAGVDGGADGARPSAFVLALFAYGMPVQLAVMSALTGAAYGLFPIAWIVFSSIMLYRLAVDTGKFEIIKDSVGGLTNDRRLQALFIAFSFGAFIEGAAGFGAPVAVSGAMLAGLGFLAVLRRRHLPAGQHGARGVRLDRHSGDDARRASPGCRCCRSARWSGACAR